MEVWGPGSLWRAYTLAGIPNGENQTSGWPDPHVRKIFKGEYIWSGAAGSFNVLCGSSRAWRSIGTPEEGQGQVLRTSLLWKRCARCFRDFKQPVCPAGRPIAIRGGAVFPSSGNDRSGLSRGEKARDHQLPHFNRNGTACSAARFRTRQGLRMYCGKYKRMKTEGSPAKNAGSG